MSGELNIRIISNLCETQQVLLYQQDIKLNVKRIKIAAWEHIYIAPNATFYTVLPNYVDIKGIECAQTSIMSTKTIRVEENRIYEIFDNNRAIDIKECGICAYNNDTIDVFNRFSSEKGVVVSKDCKPLFSCKLRPNYKLNFTIYPRLYIALSDLEVKGEFFDLSTISMKHAIDYEGQKYLTIYLKENCATGEIKITHCFEKF